MPRLCPTHRKPRAFGCSSRPWKNGNASARPPASRIRAARRSITPSARGATCHRAKGRSGRASIPHLPITTCWRGHLRGLEVDYPHVIKQPQGNHYGMHLFSRLELGASAIRFLVEDDIPSIRVTIKLRSGDRIEFFGLHPRPPEPQQDTDERDAELLMVGKELRACVLPAIVAGDLHDVAWSNTTRLFQKVSGLLDPRRGRGMFSTFHASYPLVRWPLDHVFPDKRFTLVRLQRLRSIGSDHFPVLAELQFELSAADNHAAPKADQADIQNASERIRDA